jgi:hypothetical protein
MVRSYGFPSNFASKQIIFIAHIGEIYYKILPYRVPRILRLKDVQKKIAKYYSFRIFRLKNSPDLLQNITL